MNDQAIASNAPRYTQQTVLAKANWLTGKLFSITVTRDAAFSFLPGQFARLGLCVDTPETDLSDSTLTPNEWRAYSMVSKPDGDELEFFLCGCARRGKFSPALSRLEPGDALWIDKSVFRLFNARDGLPTERIFGSLQQEPDSLHTYPCCDDPKTWHRFKRIVLLHGVRHANELAYHQELLALAKLSDSQRAQFVYLPVTSQEALTPALSPSVHPQWLSTSATYHAFNQRRARAARWLGA